MRQVAPTRSAAGTAVRLASAAAFLAGASALAGCSPDHLYAYRGDASEATVATYRDTRLSYRNADPRRALTATLPTEKGRQARRERYEDARTPHCGDRFVLNRIKRRTPLETWQTKYDAVFINAFDHPTERQYVPRRGRNQIAQRFCTVLAHFSDHHSRRIDYVVETPMGFAGVGHNVTYCIRGLSPWYVHGKACSALRHQGQSYHSELPEAKERHAKHPARRANVRLGEVSAHPAPTGERPNLLDWWRNRSRAK